MKKTLQVATIGLLALLLIVGGGAPAQAASTAEYVAIVEEELTAEYLYQQLYEKYPENILFSNLAKSENRHASALKKSMDRLDISVDSAKPLDIAIPETKEEALQFALNFEKEDIAMLEELIATEQDARLKRVFENLLRGSENHYAALDKAITQGIDNLNCDESGTRKMKNSGDRSPDERGRGRGRGSALHSIQGNVQNASKGQGNSQNVSRGIGARTRVTQSDGACAIGNNAMNQRAQNGRHHGK